MRSKSLLTVVIAFVMLFSYEIAGQTDFDPSLRLPVTTQSIKGEVSEQGWTFNYPQAVRENRTAWLKVAGTNEQIIYTSTFFPTHRSILRIENRHSRPRAKTRKANSILLNPDFIQVFDVDGKVFGYNVYGICVAGGRLPNGDKIYVNMGCKIGYTFYDTDGDGALETIIGTSRPTLISPFILHVPGWITTQYDKISVYSKN